MRQPGGFAVVGRGDNWWDVVHVADVARAWPTRRSAARTARCTTWPTTTRSRCSIREAHRRRSRGGAPRRVPAAVARLVAGGDPVAAVVRSARTSNARIKRELGWSPEFPARPRECRTRWRS